MNNIRIGERMCGKNEWVKWMNAWMNGHSQVDTADHNAYRLLPGWPTQSGLSCVVPTAILLRIIIRIAIFHPIVSSLDCMTVVICPQMIRKTWRWLKKSFSNCESPHEHQCSWAIIVLVCHYVNLMSIKMVTGWEFSKVPLNGQVRLPTGQILEGRRGRYSGFF